MSSAGRPRGHRSCSRGEEGEDASVRERAAEREHDAAEDAPLPDAATGRRGHSSGNPWIELPLREHTERRQGTGRSARVGVDHPEVAHQPNSGNERHKPAHLGFQTSTK